MNANELKAERIRQGKDICYMAAVIGKTRDSYAKKERGEVKFLPAEMLAVSQDLQLSADKFNVIFFDSELPFESPQ